MHRVLVLALLLPLSCRGDRSSAAPVDQPEDPESPPKAIPMGEHFVRAEQIRDAIIAGELDKTTQPAQWLLDNVVTEDMPLRWRPHVPKVRRSAKRIVKAETIADPAAAAGTLAAACGECHAATGARPRPPERPAPLGDDTRFAQMDRHAHAAERMWDGLVAPEDGAWVEGATSMRDAPLHGDAAPGPVASLATSLHQLAAGAVELPANDRGDRYGEVIATCASCHQQLGGPAKASAPKPGG